MGPVCASDGDDFLPKIIALVPSNPSDSGLTRAVTVQGDSFLAKVIAVPLLATD
jgi:hypothetical protein